MINKSRGKTGGKSWRAGLDRITASQGTARHKQCQSSPVSICVHPCANLCCLPSHYLASPPARVILEMGLWLNNEHFIAQVPALITMETALFCFTSKEFFYRGDATLDVFIITFFSDLFIETDLGDLVSLTYGLISNLLKFKKNFFMARRAHIRCG